MVSELLRPLCKAGLHKSFLCMTQVMTCHPVRGCPRHRPAIQSSTEPGSPLARHLATTFPVYPTVRARLCVSGSVGAGSWVFTVQASTSAQPTSGAGGIPPRGEQQCCAQGWKLSHEDLCLLGPGPRKPSAQPFSFQVLLVYPIPEPHGSSSLYLEASSGHAYLDPGKAKESITLAFGHV